MGRYVSVSLNVQFSGGRESSAAAGWSGKVGLPGVVRSGVAIMAVIPCYTNLELSPVI